MNMNQFSNVNIIRCNCDEISQIMQCELSQII